MAYDPAMAWEYECRRREKEHREWRAEVGGHINRALDLLIDARRELTSAFGQRHEIIESLDELRDAIEAEYGEE